jgi:glutaminyl-tRNA synthetase
MIVYSTYHRQIRIDKDFLEFVNTDSLTTITAMAEPAMKEPFLGETVQFQRLGYFFLRGDPDTAQEPHGFNRTATLRCPPK